MDNDIAALIAYYETEKQIDRDRVLEALSFAFISAYRKMVPGADAIENIRAHVDTKKGDATIYATLRVVENDNYQDKFNEVPLKVALQKDENAEVGGELEFDVTPKNFGRIAIQTAKQTMIQRLRQAEREKIYEEFKDRAGEIVSGVVHRFDRNDVYIDLGRFEGIMPSRERVHTEEYNIGDRIRSYVVAVENRGRGPEIILSRSHPNFVRRLFEAEVNEVADFTVEIRGIAREAGGRTKIAVWSNDPKVDPVGACVGARGARVKNIVRELNNEKVDILRWSEDPVELVREALKPAELISITPNEEEHQIFVTVKEEDLSKAIGRRGQNARLSSQLIGWDIQIRKDESKKEEFEAKFGQVVNLLVNELEISKDMAVQLVTAGATAISVVAIMSPDDIVNITNIDAAEAQKIIEKAQAASGNAATSEQVEETSAN